MPTLEAPRSFVAHMGERPCHMIADTCGSHLEEPLMKPRLFSLLALVSLCILLVLPSPTLAVPRNNDDDDDREWRRNSDISVLFR